MTLFCSDIDGTLLDSHRTLSARTVAAIRAVREAGHSFVLCSSRMPSSMAALDRLAGGGGVPLIAYNGGLVVRRDGTVAIDEHIAPEDARLVYDTCAGLDLHASFFAQNRWYAWGSDRWTRREVNHTAVEPAPESAHDYASPGRIESEPPHKVMGMGDAALVDELERVLAGRPGLVTYRSKDTYLEVASAACSKGAGVAAVARELGADLADTVFYGDNDNDLSAFAVVGTSVAVANAKPHVLAAAHETTAAHHSDGVALHLEDWLSRRG
ncbi:MAG: Cof-type family hydrolase [Humibacillus sp.]|nr:Cof-type family hydrolase [Humibacillus sp.]